MDLKSIKTAIAARDKETDQLPVHVHAFCAFISPWQRHRADMIPTDTGVVYQDIAAKGYKLASSSRAPNLEEEFREGVAQLSGRTYFAPGRVPRFEIDGIAMLGIALGYQFTECAEDEAKWLVKCLRQSRDALNSDPWQSSLVRLGLQVLEGGDDFSGVDPAVIVCMKTIKSVPVIEGEYTAAWSAVISNIGEDDASKLAAFQGVYEACAGALARLPFHGAGVPELIEILVGVSESMSHWTYEWSQRVKNVEPTRWEVDHEYHVQNLLWTILRPVFPDLVDEETLKKLGHKSPRYDLGIPSLQTIVEVKFMKKRGQRELAKITEEVAADHSLYLREGTGFTRMIVFIWDEAWQTEEYKTLRRGLESLRGVESVIILPRPSRMERNPQS